MTQDYRDILKERLSERMQKNSKYSIRAFARDLGISPQRLSHVLAGKYGLSPEAAEGIADTLGLNESEKTLFVTLVQERHARSRIMKANAKARLAEMKSNYQSLNLEHFKIISEWYHFAIMELSLIEGFRSDPKWISRQLGVSEVQVKMGIERLLKLEMIEKDKLGKLRITGNYFADPHGIPSQALRSFHRQLLEKAIVALECQGLEEREVLSTVLALDEREISEAKVMLRKFREEFDQRFSRSKKKTSVYCLGIQLHRLNTK